MGRPAGTKNKRTIDGGILARDILEQTAADVEVEDPNPVKERLKRQAREGVGPGVGQLPASVFVHLCDRAYGKVVDYVKLKVGGKAYENETTEALAKRAELLAAALRSEERRRD